MVGRYLNECGSIKRGGGMIAGVVRMAPDIDFEERREA